MTPQTPRGRFVNSVECQRDLHLESRAGVGQGDFPSLADEQTYPEPLLQMGMSRSMLKM